MKLRQLRYIHEVAKRGLNVTAAADRRQHNGRA
jgi:hypothetical protein